MNVISAMSDTELIHQLLAPPHPTAISETAAMYAATYGISTHDPLVRDKLAVARELLLRDLIAQMKSSPVLSSPAAVRAWLKLRCANLEHEVFIILHLDTQNRLIEAEEIFRGTLTHTSVYPREVVKSVISRNTSSILIAHNHPSGKTESSHADRALTANLKSALALVDVRILDHFIVSGDKVASFAEQGLL